MATSACIITVVAGAAKLTQNFRPEKLQTNHLKRWSSSSFVMLQLVLKMKESNLESAQIDIGEQPSPEVRNYLLLL